MADNGRAPSGQALVASDGAATHLHPSGFDPSRFARKGFNEFGKISLDENGERLGLIHGLRAEESRSRFRCGECNQYQRPGSWLVWIEDGLRKGDPDWAFEDSVIYRGGHWSGNGWCLSCAPKRKRALAKATPTRSAKTTKIGLVRRMVARCRQAFAQTGVSE